MKYFYNKIWMMSFLLVSLFGFSSCMDDDDRMGYEIQGHWFGDMNMYHYYTGEKALGSEIEFKTGWGFDHGTGVEVDYYRRGSVTNYFDWRVKDLILYLTFEDSYLDCAIVDYRLTTNYFRGYIADYNTLENLVPFSLRNYDNEWEEYGYGNYYDYVKGSRAATDSIAADSTSVLRGIRGIYLNK